MTNPTKKNALAYAAILDRLLLDHASVNMNSEEKCDLFQKLAKEAATLTGSSTQKNMTNFLHLSKSIRKLWTRWIKLEASISKRSKWARAQGLDPHI